jgi:hypothetical protein
LAGQAILQKANAKPLAVVKANDFKQVYMAQMMLDQGQKAVDEASAKLQTITADRYHLLAKTITLSSQERRKCSKETESHQIK